MPNVIRHKRSTTAGVAPSAGQLTDGELAINVADGALFTKNSSGAIVSFPSLPLTAEPGMLLMWTGSGWVATSIWHLISGDGNESAAYADGGNAASPGVGLMDGNCCP